jgi:hypothetical protein
MEDFPEWLRSPQGQLSEQALFEVMDSLEKCSVDPQDRVFIWEDGARLSIGQSAHRIHVRSDLPLSQIESHVIGWLEMHYVPEGLNEQQMEEFESMIDAWISDHQNSPQ